MVRQFNIGQFRVSWGGDTGDLERASRRANSTLREGRKQYRRFGEQAKESGRLTRLFNTSLGELRVGSLAAVAGLTALVRAQVQFISNSVEQSREILRSSRNLGVTVEQYQGLSQAFQRIGFDSDKVLDVFRDINLNLADPAKLEAFNQLGINPQLARNLSNYERITLVLERLADIDDTSLRTFLAGEVAGGPGEEIAGDIGRLLDLVEFQRRFGVVTTEAATANNRLLESFQNVAQAASTTFQNFLGQFSRPLAEVIDQLGLDIVEFTDDLEDAGQEFGRFLRDNKSILTDIFEILKSSVELARALARFGSFAVLPQPDITPADINRSPIEIGISNTLNRLSSFRIGAGVDESLDAIDRSLKGVEITAEGVNMTFRQTADPALRFVNEEIAKMQEELKQAPANIEAMNRRLREQHDILRRNAEALETRRQLIGARAITTGGFDEGVDLGPSQQEIELQSAQASYNALLNRQVSGNQDISESWNDILTNIMAANDELTSFAGSEAIDDLSLNFDEIAAKSVVFNDGLSKIGDTFDGVFDSLEGSFSVFLEEVIKGNKSIGDSFKALGRTIIAELTKAFVIRPLIGALRGGFGSIFGGLFGRQFGGPVAAGTPYIVGEAGPELFVPSSSGNIVPNGSFGGVNVTNYIDARGADENTVRRMQNEVLPGFVNASVEQNQALIADPSSAMAGTVKTITRR